MSRLSVALVVGVVALVPSRLHAQPIERVVAFVDDTPIFLSQLERRVRLRFSADGQVLATSWTRGRALETLIDDVLLERTAERHGMPVTEELLTEAVEGVRAGADMSAEGHRRALQAVGSSPEAHRDELRSQLLRLRSMQVLTHARVQVSEQEIRREYDRRQAEREGRRYPAAMVTIAVAQGARTEVARQAEQLAREVLAQLRADRLSVAEAIARYGGVSMREWDADELLSPLGAALVATAPGSLSEVVATRQGATIVSRGPGRGGSMAPYEQARRSIYEDLYRTRLAVEEPLVMQELRDEALIVRRLPPG